MKCPECNQEVTWVGDNDCEDGTHTTYHCEPCRVDIIKGWDEGGESNAQ